MKMRQNNKKPILGGQAIIEGVMIKSPSHVTMAVRSKDNILFKSEKINTKKASKIFFVRGIVNLYDMLIYGTKAIIWSSQQQEYDGKEMTKTEIMLTMMLSVTLVIGIFIVLPYFLTSLTGVREQSSPVAFNLLDGIIRVIFFLTYLYLISLLKDVRVLFQYHGAEHKAIHCYEANKPLKIENIKPFSPIHPRCGTSFIMIVFLISIIVFSFVPGTVRLIIPKLFQMNIFIQKSILFFTRILLIPVIAGISYEILRLNTVHSNNVLMKVINFPGMLIQKITTKEPEEKQIEVAIASLKKALEAEGISTNY